MFFDAKIVYYLNNGSRLKRGQSLTSGEIISLVFMSMIVLFVLILTVYCCCVRNKAYFGNLSVNNYRLEKKSGKYLVTDQLIPPVFYTQSLENPLKQDDFREGIK